MVFEEISAGAVVFRKKGNAVKYLLLYKKAHRHYKEQWGFPRGWIEGDESLEEAAKREISEETGITDISFVEGFKETISFTYVRDKNTVHKKVVYFLAKTASEKVKLSFEHDDHGWFSFQEALTKLSFENDKEILKKARVFAKHKRLNDYV